MIFKNYNCLQGYEQCGNVTFTDLSVGQLTTSQYGLLPGYGCYVQINRLLSGTVGTLQITFTDPTSILVFDNYDLNYTSGDTLVMPLADYGWAPRTVLVVNIGS